MKKVIKEFPKVVLKSYKDKKEELDDFFDSVTMEVADYEHFNLIKSKKVEFLDWLNSEGLYRLLINFDLIEPMTQFEWECRQQILSYIAKFDLYMLQCMKTEQFEYGDIYLRRKMSEFDINYNLGDI